MSLTKLTIPPDSANYVITDGTEANRQQLDGGSGAYRRDILNATAQVAVGWTVDENKYNYLRAFYRSVTEKGSLPFSIDLVLDYARLVTYTAHFIPGSFGTPRIQGATYVIGAMLEVEPDDVDEAFDLSLVEVINAFGDETDYALNLLNIIVNVKWPV